jgi:uncharacterized protein (TIGR00251 family)
LSEGPVKTVTGGVRVSVRLAPKSSRDAVSGLMRTADGGWVIKASVTAVPEAGRANEALIRLLAKQWGVPRSSVGVVAGAAERNKILHVSGDPDDLVRRIEGWLAPFRPVPSSQHDRTGGPITDSTEETNG